MCFNIHVLSEMIHFSLNLGTNYFEAHLKII
jgi:hypothetical protein